jgi:PAS domain S-box-containing protein
MDNFPRSNRTSCNDVNQGHGNAGPANWNTPEKTVLDPPRPHLLVVDDDLRVSESMRDLLATRQHHCQLAADADQAMRVLSEQRIDLLILDINLPGQNGLELLGEVKEKWPDLAVVMVSGESSFENAAQALRGGARDFLRKPYRPEDLLHTVDRVLEQRRMGLEIARMQQQLAISEQRHRFIVRNSPDLIYMLDGEGRFTFINDRITDLLGYQPEEIIGKHYRELVHAADIEKALYAFNERRTGDRACRNVELRLRHKDVQHDALCTEVWTVPIELNAMGIYFSVENSGKPCFAGTYGVARDITERKRAEALVQYQLKPRSAYRAAEPRPISGSSQPGTRQGHAA